MGDVVLTSPVIRCLKTQVPNATVHVLTKQQNKVLLEENPYIDQLFCIQNRLGEVIPALKAENYDYVIDLHNNIRSFILKFRLFAVSFSFHKLNLEKFLITAFKINVLPKEHVVDRYLRTVRYFGVKNDGQGLDFFIPEHLGIDFSLIPESHRINFVAFCIGGTYNTKRLPVEKIVRICESIKSPIFLLGGPEDKTIADTITGTLGSRIYNGCGIFSIYESASIVKHAKLVITHDTGFMHIASAFKKNIISIWGNTIPEFGMSPYLPGDKSRIVEVSGLKCRPCHKLGYSACPKTHFKCMQNINEVFIHQYVNELLR